LRNPVAEVGDGGALEPNDGNEMEEVFDAVDNDLLPSYVYNSPTGSLHDELRCQRPHQLDTHRVPKKQIVSGRPMATQSRPCYRCISHMHAVGIKRVSWTNSDGEWEGAKVQQLVDIFDDPEIPAAKVNAGRNSKALFVTKHEVLQLRAGQGCNVNGSGTIFWGRRPCSVLSCLLRD